ncbi:MAG: sensor histidine kinase, partial [Pseudobdellovibrionaceae bacterium]
VYNLFSNAVKFTEDNGAISIDCGLNNRGEMCLAISDSGVGMSPEELERATKPFDLVQGEHSRANYGIGLGLTLVQMLIQLHGGRLEIMSQKGQGTCATLIFPNNRVRSKRKAEAPVTVAPEVEAQKNEEQQKQENIAAKSAENADPKPFEKPKSVH